MSCFRTDWLSRQMSILVLLLVLKSLSATSSSTHMSTATEHETEKEKSVITVHVLAVVPNVEGVDDANLLPKWEQGEEILPGAYLAASEIGKLFSGYRLEVIPVRVPRCDLNEGIVPFVEELTSKENNIIGIVGYFCHNIAQHFSEMIKHNKTNVVQISATSLDKDSVPHIQYGILPISESTAMALVQLILRLGWSKVAVLSSQNTNFLDAKHAFLKEAKQQGIKIISQFEISHIPHSYYTKEFLDELQHTGAKIVVNFLPLYEAVDIFCTAYRHGFRWPQYAWIFTDLSAINEIWNNSKFCCQTTAGDAMNGAIFLHHHLNNFYDSSTGLRYVACPNESLDLSEREAVASLEGNPYTNVLHDSVWAIAHAFNRSLSILDKRNFSLSSISIRANQLHARSKIMDVLEEQLSELLFRGATGFLNFSRSTAAMQTSVILFQFQNGQPIGIGSYNYSLNRLFLNTGMMLGNTPTDKLNRIYVVNPIYVTVILLIMTTMCFSLTFISMCLYFHYRKHPSIKATSSILSSCLFIGCYFLLASSSFHTINSEIIIQQKMGKSYRAFICMFDIYLINTGTDIVLATVIAKTLRIYHIFKKFGKVNQICSDQGLFTLILAIVSVKIILLIFWTSLDISYLVDIEQYIKQSIPPYFQVRQKCQNEYPTVWLMLHYTYSTILALIMVLLAVLTRKIKRDNFKDTKKINILVGALFFDMCIVLPLWAILRLTDSTTNLSRMVYSTGITLAAFFCQVFLILPKIVPLVLHDCRCSKTWKSYVSTSYSALRKKLNTDRNSL